jgi:hypothetical protein|tara:strand:+ start:43 stop:255 length:213 start_codon:yes stop_codon:yes gene_type:complete
MDEPLDLSKKRPGPWDNETKKWYQIKAAHPVMGVVRFWLLQKNEDDVRQLVIKKKYNNIEWIRQETPPFI